MYAIGSYYVLAGLQEDGLVDGHGLAGEVHQFVGLLEASGRFESEDGRVVQTGHFLHGASHGLGEGGVPGAMDRLTSSTARTQVVARRIMPLRTG